MQLRGKIAAGIVGIFVGDLLGLPFGGLTGFFLGSLLGHFLFDRPREVEDGESEFKEYRRKQGRFVYHVMVLCAKMAKADGPVNHHELNFMERLMREKFRLNDRGRSDAIRIWNQTKENNDPFEHLARSFYSIFGAERYHVNDMLDLLFAVAAADGGLHRREEELLLRAAGVFHISRLQYERIKSRYFHVPPQQQARYSPLDPHYAILGARETDSLDAIKKKFRALALQWHPDRMTAKGASPDALRHAKEKFQQINEAYERIVEARRG